MKTFKTINQEALELLKNKRLFKNNYKMKCLTIGQKIKIFFNSWFAAIQILPLVREHLKKELKEKNG